MADTIDVLLHYIEENWTQARQSENQRATISNLIVIIAAALSGVVTQTGFNKNSLPLALIMIVFGIYGVIASAKLYERSKFHIERARKLRKRLDELCPDAQVSILQDAADVKHNRKYKILSKPIDNYVWVFLHIFIALLGVVFTIIIIPKF
jgi:hypothetical protein